MTLSLYDLRRAWGWLGQRVSLADAAARLGVRASELDVAIWDWRTSLAGTTEAEHRSPEHIARLRRLAPFDAVAAKALAIAEERAAA